MPAQQMPRIVQASARTVHCSFYPNSPCCCLCHRRFRRPPYHVCHQRQCSLGMPRSESGSLSKMGSRRGIQQQSPLQIQWLFVLLLLQIPVLCWLLPLHQCPQGWRPARGKTKLGGTRPQMHRAHFPQSSCFRPCVSFPQLLPPQPRFPWPFRVPPATAPPTAPPPEASTPAGQQFDSQSWRGRENGPRTSAPLHGRTRQTLP
mmetsp:Transcript_53479/g.160031  ORF Transcript_53479/g.160031 Transcript_53479/m.160031 type:complete len:203 (+) Transcript_53479:1727-2335(+)